MSVTKNMRHIYPRFCALHNLGPDDVAPLPPPDQGITSPEWLAELLPGASTRVRMPPLIRDTYTCMEAHGIYLIGQKNTYHLRCSGNYSFNLLDNEDVIVLWIGSNVHPQHLVDLFGVDSVHDIDAHVVSACLSRTSSLSH